MQFINLRELFFSVFLLVFLTTNCIVSPKYTTKAKALSIPVDKNVDNTVTTPPETEPAKFTNSEVIKVEEGTASYYADKFHGRPTASGEIFDMHKVSAAHRTLPLGTVARVTNLRNNKSIILRINDRGPFIKGRILDVSYEAAKQLDFIIQGTAPVKIEVLKTAENK